MYKHGYSIIIYRGRVENTTFEAKAKDTHKKIPGQGPTSLGQTLSRPRTKDTRRNCFPKKRSPKIFFTREDAKFPRKIRRSSKKKKRFLQTFREVTAVFQGKVKRRPWPWPIFNKSKKVLSSSRRQVIFEDL